MRLEATRSAVAGSYRHALTHLSHALDPRPGLLPAAERRENLHQR